MLWKIGASVCAAISVAAVLGAVARVGWLEEREVRFADRATLEELSERPGATEQSVRLARVRLYPEQEAVFELCADDPMEPEQWAGAMAVAVWRPRGRELMTRSELSPEVLGLVRRDEARGCLTIGRGTIEEEDDYQVDALYEERPERLVAIPLTIRVVARRSLEGLDRGLVILAWLGSLGLVGFLALRRRDGSTARAATASAGGLDGGGAPSLSPAREREGEPDLWEAELAKTAKPWPPEARVALGLVLVVTSFMASGLLPGGAASGLAVGVTLALFETGCGVALAPGPGIWRRLDLLALRAPERWWLHFPIAIVAGALLVFLARWSTQLVPSTGRSPIQVFVSFPSGMLSFAALAVVAPLAEEVFFRGFVYGVLEKRDRIAAFLGGWLLFVIAHAPQTWGQWGALVAIGVTGLGLTSIRALSGSTLVAAVAHLTYNGLLALSALF